MENDINKIKISHLIICLITGAVLPLAFAPFNYFFIAIISPAILFFLWVNTSPKTAFTYGFVFGFGMFGTGVNWLHISINMFGGVNLFGSLIITCLFVALLAMFPAIVGYVSRRFFRTHNIIYLSLLIPALWVISEWCRSWILTGFPWLTLGYSQIDSPISGLAPITGVYGVSWLVCVCAALLVYIFLAAMRHKAAATLFLFILCAGVYGLKDIDWTRGTDKELKVALIQGAIPQELKWKESTRQYTRDLYLSLSKPHLDNDLIIWPETAIPAFYHEADFFIKPLLPLLEQHNVALLTGIAISDHESQKYFNSIISIGKQDDFYNKRHLVPFGEYLPFDKWLRPFLDFLHIPMSNFSSGNNQKPLIKAAGELLGVSICYEDVFGEEVIEALPEAGLLVNISNDAWFGDSIASHQHLQMARMRSLETGRYMLRATNTGVSAIIDNKGKIISRSPQFKPHVISERVRIYAGATPYVKVGNSLVITAAFLFLFIAQILNRMQGNVTSKPD